MIFQKYIFFIFCRSGVLNSSQMEFSISDHCVVVSKGEKLYCFPSTPCLSLFCSIYQVVASISPPSKFVRFFCWKWLQKYKDFVFARCFEKQKLLTFCEKKCFKRLLGVELLRISTETSKWQNLCEIYWSSNFKVRL